MYQVPCTLHGCWSNCVIRKGMRVFWYSHVAFPGHTRQWKKPTTCVFMLYTFNLYYLGRKVNVGAIINRPGVAGAVLQSPPSLSDHLVQISSKNCQSQTRRARELKFSENVHPTLCVMWHVPRVTCHVSCVTCNLSCVTCHTLFFLYKKKEEEKTIFL